MQISHSVSDAFLLPFWRANGDFQVFYPRVDCQLFGPFPEFMSSGCCTSKVKILARASSVTRKDKSNLYSYDYFYL